MRRVYFIRPIGIERGPIKIGCSSHPPSRKIALATWSPYPLEIVAEISGDLITERRFHAAFRDQHQHGEWFTWSQPLQAVIDAIRNGTFDVSSLPEPASLHLGRKGKIGHKWTLEQKAQTRFSNAVLRVMKKTGQRLPAGVSSWSAFKKGGEDLARAQAFLFDPYTYGVSSKEIEAAHAEELLERRKKEVAAAATRLEQAKALLEAA